MARVEITMAVYPKMVFFTKVGMISSSTFSHRCLSCALERSVAVSRDG